MSAHSPIKSLETLFCRISLADTLRAERVEGGSVALEVVEADTGPAEQNLAVRAAEMATRVGMLVVGVVENMSWLVGTGQEVFGAGGCERLAEEVGAPLLGKVPLDPALREAADAGVPARETAPDAEGVAAIDALAEALQGTRACSIRKALTVL